MFLFLVIPYKLAVMTLFLPTTNWSKLTFTCRCMARSHQLLVCVWPGRKECNLPEIDGTHSEVRFREICEQWVGRPLQYYKANGRFIEAKNDACPTKSGKHFTERSIIFNQFDE
jgi:hypothetical protein